MKLAKNANGSIPRFASGAVQEWATDCVTCCDGDVCGIGPEVPCSAGETARFEECTGKVSTHLTITDVDAESIGPYTDFTTWTADGMGGWTGNPYPSAPVITFNTTATAGITGLPDIAPAANAVINNGNTELDRGYYGYSISQTVNGSTSTFDVLPTTGFSLSVSHSDISEPNPSPGAGGYTTWTVGRDATFIDTVYREYNLYALSAPDGADISAQYQWSVTYYRNTLTLDHLTTATAIVPLSTAYYVNDQRTDALYFGGRNAPLDGESIGGADPCGDIAFDIDNSITSARIGRGVTSPVSASSAASGKVCTVQYATPDLDKAGCRDCPRALTITTTFETTVHPTEGDPFYDPNDEQWITYDDILDPDHENPIPGPDAVLETVTCVQTVYQTAVAQCGTYLCEWDGGTATVTTSGGDFPFTGGSYFLARVTSIYYQLRGPFGAWDLKLASGDCPDGGSFTVRQDPNPHEQSGTGSGITYTPVAPYTSTFTSRTVSIDSAPCDENSPAYYCDVGGAAPSSVSFDINCDTGSDDPPGWAGPETLTKQACASPVSYLNTDADGFTVKLWYDNSSSKWKYTVVYNLTGETALTGELLGSDTDPTGSYGYVSAQPFGAFASFDDVCGSLNVVVS